MTATTETTTTTERRQLTGFAKTLAELELGQSAILRDGAHRGVTIIRGRNEWAVLDLENSGVTLHARLLLVSSDIDDDETGLNRVCVGCDLDGPRGLWLVPEDCELDCEVGKLTIEWDSDCDMIA